MLWDTDAFEQLEILKSDISNSKTRKFNVTPWKKKGSCVAWNCSGDLIAASSENSLKVWPILESSKDLSSLSGHKNNISWVKWNPLDPFQLASLDTAACLRIWDTRSPRVIHVSENFDGEGFHLDWSPDGTNIVCATKSSKHDNIVQIDTRTGYSVSKRSTYVSYIITRVSFGSDSSKMYLTTGSGAILVQTCMEGETNRRPMVGANTTGTIQCISSNSNGEKLVIGSSDSIITLWDSEELICERAFPNCEDSINAVGISSDDQIIGASCHDKTISLIHVPTGDTIETINCSESSPASIHWHPNQRILAFLDGTAVKLWCGNSV
eukprot:TRINITY_DN231_c0_g2_i2.p1 TRINITY_DN231_c0_g2~~TRINITY_DN231_c0_g2_i2.p1  ORF type:complete len:324 (-),score=46.38 TRINITY_DN231_c0_g2_i2:23-994(-)